MSTVEQNIDISEKYDVYLHGGLPCRICNDKIHRYVLTVNLVVDPVTYVRGQLMRENVMPILEIQQKRRPSSVNLFSKEKISNKRQTLW